ncbi:MAG: adenylate/guanylate cyclase domain-containing protein [Alphaproteobacteria bacterium]|nr:adenylate/guanylate cyclase domain-containing protein [Alphaproteobacteria bacterium]
MPPPDSARPAVFTLRDLRLASGLVIAAFVVCHLTNHALGLVSIAAMDGARPWIMLAWQSLPGQVALYGALLVHAALGLYALVRRRTFRMPWWEAAQLALGLAVPYLLLTHIVNTRVTRVLAGIDIDYVYELSSLWVVDPWVRAQQITLVLLVWGHLLFGLHFWLRLKPWYRSALPAFAIVYALVPTLALLGFAQGGIRLAAQEAVAPGTAKAVLAKGKPADPEAAALRLYLKADAAWFYLALVGAGLAVVLIRPAFTARGFAVRYPGGAVARGRSGMSVLEVSRAAARPHMSVCGGRARCTTCRVKVVGTAGPLPEPRAEEARALARIAAPPDIRLACQLKPASDIEILPLLNPTLVQAPRGGDLQFGDERTVTILFVDLRGSSRLAEQHLPFDVVFILNAYLEEMARAVSAAQGHYSNFTGDGLMALFGLAGRTQEGARRALQAAGAMLERLEILNRRLTGEFGEALKIGIGIHTGEAIVGRLGPPGAPFLTALGDTVNTAARLESLTKETGAPVLVSSVALAAAGLLDDTAALRSFDIRGRHGAVAALALDPEQLARLTRATDS